jgi:ribosomal protein S18 acetylase RimI-like enzyme
MPEISIRPTTRSDLPALKAIYPGYTSSRVWQLERQNQNQDIRAHFREVRLPREARIEYPRSVESIFEGFDQNQDLFLSALLSQAPVGYLRLSELVSPSTAWVKDWVVREDLRRQGIGSALLVAGQEWSAEAGYQRMVVEVQSKNCPAIQLVQKMGFEFAGFNDHFYANQDIAIFFATSLK